MFNKILVVCHGNICRSPIAEAMLKECMPGRRVESAGIGALVDHPVEATAAELAAAEGLDVSAHRARQLKTDMIQGADLILVMSPPQIAAIAELAPAATGKTMLLGRWLPEGGALGREIPDPYRKSREVFEYVHQLLRQSADSWQNKLK